MSRVDVDVSRVFTCSCSQHDLARRYPMTVLYDAVELPIGSALNWFLETSGEEGSAGAVGDQTPALTPVQYLTKARVALTTARDYYDNYNDDLAARTYGGIAKSYALIARVAGRQEGVHDDFIAYANEVMAKADQLIRALRNAEKKRTRRVFPSTGSTTDH